MKKLSLVLVGPFMVGFVTNLFAQTIISSPDEWNCINIEFDLDANITGDTYPFAKMIETPHGVLLFGRFSEINDVIVNNIALYKDYGIEDAGIDIAGDIMEVLVNGTEVFFITSYGIFTWDGETITDWGISIQMFPGYENNWVIEGEIIGEDVVISGFIEKINDEYYNTLILNKNTKIIEHKLLLPGPCSGFGKIDETFYFGYNYWPWSSPTSYDYQPLISFNPSTSLMDYVELGIPSPWISELIEHNGKIIFFLNMYPDQDEVVVYDGGASFDFTGYFAFGKFIKKETDLYLGGGIYYNYPGEVYDGNSGLLKYTDDYMWEILTDTTLKSVTANSWINNTWYATEEFGSVNSYTDYLNGEEINSLCLPTTNFSIAKLGEAEIEVPIEETKPYEIQIFFSGENLIVNSSQKEDSIIEVYSITGNLVLSATLSFGTNSFHFPQPPGIYITNKNKLIKI